MDWQQVLAFAGGIIGIILAIALLVRVIIRLKITNKSGISVCILFNRQCI